MTLKEFILSNVKPEVYYKWKFPQWNERARPTVLCPFHDDTEPSLAVGLDRGGARCHADSCGKKLGNIVHFESELSGDNELDSAKRIYTRFIRPTITRSELVGLGKILINTPSYAKDIWKDTSLTKASLERFKLGYDTSSNRLTIPIFDRFGFCTNIRYYCLPSHRTVSTQVKIYNHTIKNDKKEIVQSFGYLEFFPWNEIKKFSPKEPVLWMKAEKDTMIALQMGYQAFCLTNGEGTWLDEISEVFEGYEIIVVLPNDVSGKSAGLKRIKQLHEQSINTRACHIPDEASDFADWIVSGGGTKGQFDKLLATDRIDSNRLQRSAVSPPPSGRYLGFTMPKFFSDDPTCYHHLIEVGRNTELLNVICRVRAIVSGKLDKTYAVPYKFMVSSTACPRKEYTLPFGRELLHLVGLSDDAVCNYIRVDLLRNSKAKLEIVERVAICELELIPALTPEYESPYVTQKCFYVGENIETNVPYEMEIMPTTQVRSQETVGIVTKATPISRSVTTFNFSPEEIAELEQFKCGEGDNVIDSIYNLLNDYSFQFSQIYNRVDWHMVALLTWCSPLQFYFPNEGIQRGWINTLALGDTQTGKSEVVESIRNVTNSGTFINGENCTYVGLVGGAIKSAGGQFMLRWGKIPLNNRQLVILEELSGLSIEEISNLSEIRSSGVAKLDKGGLSSETSARTRLICLSNVRGRNKTLAGYISGVRAIQDLIGHGEDISRFDLICTLTDTEVSAEIINKPRDVKAEELLNRDGFKTLIRFCWSLRPEQILITHEAYLACLSETIRMSKLYHHSVPLFKAGNGRLRLARVGCAIACMQFNWDGTRISVTREHILAAVCLLEMLYNKPSCGYLEYSEQMFYRSRIENEDTLDQTIKSVLNTDDRKKQTFKYLLHAGRFTLDELSSVSGVQIYDANKVLGKFVNSNIIRKGEANTWEVTPIGKTWLDKQMKNGHSITIPKPPAASPPSGKKRTGIGHLFGK